MRSRDKTVWTVRVKYWFTLRNIGSVVSKTLENQIQNLLLDWINNVRTFINVIRSIIQSIIKFCFWFFRVLDIAEYTLAPWRANLFYARMKINTCLNSITRDKVKERHFYATKRFIDDLGTLNEGVYSVMFTKISIFLRFN